MTTLINTIKETFAYKQGNLYRSARAQSPLTQREIYMTLMERDPNFNWSPMQVNEAITQAIAELATAPAPVETAPRFANEIEFIKAVLQSKGIDCNYRGDKFKQVLSNGNTRDIELDHVYDYLEYELGAYNRTTDRETRFQVGTVKASLGVLLHETNNNMYANLQLDLMFDQTCLPYVDPTIKRILNVMKIEGDVDVLVTIIKHFLWTVKRNLFAKATVNEIWLAIYGAQACGKNYVAKHVFAGPLGEFYVETELNKLGDIDREIRKFTENLVVNFDELAMGTGDKSSKLNETMLQNLKTIVTRKELVFRQMGGQKQIKMDKKFSAMSTANHHLYDVIYDQTGMRRFFELTSAQPAGVQFDNAEVASIKAEMIKVYKGIDENNDRGYLDFSTEIGRKIHAIQCSYKPRTSIHEWMDDMGIVKSDDKDMAGKDLYRMYRTYCGDYGYSAFGYKNYINVMKELSDWKQKNHQLYFCVDVRSDKPESPIRIPSSVATPNVFSFDTEIPF